MIITPQLIFMIVGIVSFVVAAILLVVSIVYYVRNDIRGVRDDLSGKTRQTSERGEGGRARSRARRGAQRPQASAEVTEEVAIRNVPDAVLQPQEDELDTVLDTKLRKISTAYDGISSDGYDVNDDMPTLVTSLGDYHQTDMPENKMKDDDVPTIVDQNADDAPTLVEEDEGQPNSTFVVTRSVIALNSSEVITAG